MNRRSFLTSSSLGATRMALSQGIGSAAMQTRTCLGSRIVDSGGGYCSQNVMPVHFGLPKEGPVDVEVTSLKCVWPQGNAGHRRPVCSAGVAGA